MIALFANGHSIPRNILLATDLSCRSDRALDRAVGLARHWDARLIAATVLEPEPSDLMDPENAAPGRVTPAARARRTLASHLASAQGAVEIVVAAGEPASELQAIAEIEDCDVIVAGAAQNGTLGSLFVAGTVKQLVKASAKPVLVVHDRPVGSYTNIVVAADRSEGARQALLTSARLFPDAQLTLFHAQNFSAGASSDFERTAQRDEALRADLLGEILSDDRVDEALEQRLELVVATGSLDVLIGEFAAVRGADLTVVGSHGHRAIFEAFVGSTEQKLLENHAGDLLIVPTRADQQSATASG